MRHFFGVSEKSLPVEVTDQPDKNEDLKGADLVTNYDLFHLRGFFVVECSRSLLIVTKIENLAVMH